MREFDSDYYEILKVGHDADPDQIKLAFRKLAMEYHPDKSHKDDESFIRLRQAYETLSDPDTREEYDRYLFLLAGNDSLIEIKPVVQDLYEDLVGYLKEVMGFNKGSEYEIVLKHEYGDRDKIVRFSLPIEMICRRCLGTGGTIMKACPLCGGRGKHVYEKSFDLFIPSGSATGEEMLLTFPGQKLKLILRYR
jgi:molecular chaperone DnaJ